MSKANTEPAANDAEPIAATVKESLTVESKRYDNNPSYKRRRQYQQQLAKLIQARELGDLKALGRAAIKRYVGCGDDRAISLQTELVELGHAVIHGRSVRWDKAA